MSGQDYLYTWSSQENAPNFDVESTTEDSYITPDGDKVYDLSSCSYQLHFGLKNRYIQQAIKDQLDVLPTISAKANFHLKTEATERLLQYINLEGKIFYTVSGAESVENALKIARLYTGKKVILSRKKSYHGATLGALSITGDWRRDDHPTLDQCHEFIPEPDSPDCIEKTREIIEKIGSENIAALCVETITGGNGVIIPSKKWWKEISALLKENNILLICDEVICGFHRTGKPFGFMHFDIQPDIVTMAKGISGGFIPFGAVFISMPIAKFFDKNILSCGLTNYAHPLGLAALHSVLNIIQDKNFLRDNERVQKTLQDFKDKHTAKFKDIRLIGSLMAIEVESHQLTWRKFIEGGVYVNIIGNNIIFAPILNTESSKLESNLLKALDVIQRNI